MDNKNGRIVNDQELKSVVGGQCITADPDPNHGVYWYCLTCNKHLGTNKDNPAAVVSEHNLAGHNVQRYFY